MTNLSKTLSAALFSTLLLQPLAAQAQDEDAAPAESEQVAPAVEAELEPATAEYGTLPLDELRTFADVFNQIRAGYVEEVDDKTLLSYAIRGMLNGLDPHSAYLDTEQFENLQTSTTGEFSGLGLEVGMENGFVKVISPIDDTPAQRAGLETGDVILKLDSKPVKGMSLNESIELMRGDKGSSIDLTIAREGLNEPFTVTLIRDIIRVVSVRQRWLEPGYGYVRIAQFQSGTGDDLNKSLAKLMDDQELKGLVLDLRNNPGGVLRASVAVADHFLDGGLVVYTEGRLEHSETRYNAGPLDTTGGVPVVVLINGGSASASEIVAGALQDHRRAVIMGTPSFGKGSVQTIMPLSEERAIKLTTAIYFTPNGRSIQAQGITPDIEVERARVTAYENLPPRITEADLNNRLDNANGSSADTRSNKRAPNELLSRDNQLYEALTLLKGLHILSLFETDTQAP